MGEALARRGPDGSGFWFDGSTALGHRKLCATAESLNEQQPLTDESGKISLTLDARVDNREELRSALRGAGYTLRDDSDAELVLRAYQYWGEDCPSKLLGDFAFAIWDARKRQLFCARDQLGLKPFFYHFGEHTFLFASEIQALFRYGGLDKAPNLNLIGLYIAERYVEREETLYRSVLRLPAAHCLMVRDGRLETRKYWDVDPENSIRYRTDSEYEEHFRELLVEAVRCRLRSGGPVMASLSGGLDSSSVVCIVQKLIRDGNVPDRGFETFSNVFPGMVCDESGWIRQVIEHTGVKSNFVPYREDSPTLALERSADYPDVMYDPMTYDVAPLYGEFRSRGVRVVLDGVGGDELFTGGLSYLTDMFRHGHWLRLWSELGLAAKLISESPYSLFRDFCIRPLVPEKVKAALRPMLRRNIGGRYAELFSTSFLSSTEFRERLQATFRVPKFPTSVQQEIYGNFFWGWNTLVVFDSAELFTARFSAEMRRPYMDRRLVEFMIAVPQDQRMRGVWSKRLLRQSMAGILPRVVQRRKDKADYSPALDVQFQKAQAKKVKNLFENSVLAALGVVDRIQVVRLLERYQHGSQEYLTGIIELLVGLELWVRTAVTGTKNREELEDGEVEGRGQRTNPCAQTILQA